MKNCVLLHEWLIFFSLSYFWFCVRTIQQLLRSRHEHGTDVGVIPPQLHDAQSKLTDEATKKQIAILANMPTKELWDCLQKSLTEGSTSINMAIFNLDTVGSEPEPSYN